MHCRSDQVSVQVEAENCCHNTSDTLISAPMSTVASRVTQLSATFPPVFTNRKSNFDPFISSCKNVLAIDLVENENSDNPIQTSDKVQGYPKRVLREDLTSDAVRVEREMLKASQGPVHIRERDWLPSAEQLDRNTLLIHRIRKVVSEDAARQEDRIDCVEIGPEPWPEHLRALDGLSPKHLRVNAGFEETIDVFELDKLSTKFKLESLCISDVVEDWSTTSDTYLHSANDPSFPEFFTHVTSLTLHYCHSLSFRGTNLPAHLRQLKIIGNDSMDMFILAMDKMPNASEQLEKVLIYTKPALDMHRFRLNDFRERLERSKGLKELTFIVADDYEARVAKCADFTARYPPTPGNPKWKDPSAPFDVGLARSLPDSIERLEFHCTNSEPMLADLDLWIEAAKDPDWLPRLKYIHICVYQPEMDTFHPCTKPARTVDIGRDRIFSEKSRRVYEVLKSRDPPVEVGQ